MSDLISRQAAIDLLEKSKEKDAKGDISTFYNTIIQNSIEAISELPSVQPEQHWILCEQRMPEEREWIGTKRFGTTISDEVFVTFESPDGERFVKHLCFQNGKVSSYDQQTIDVFHKGAVPIAWMPLPEPMRGENE